jgi:hypothetical protein
MTSSAALWAGIVAMGVYHGLNPAMGWPLAVANGLADKRDAAVFSTWVPLGVGHLLAMAVVLVPFAALAWLARWGTEVRLAAGVLVVLFGLARLVRTRHPRFLARVRPTQLMLWSFLMATAHGAALMLLPMLMGLCEAPASAGPPGAEAQVHEAMGELMRRSAATAVMVSLVHAAAMVAAGLGIAWVVYRYLGLRVLRAAWLDLDRVWALCLVAAGGAALAMAWPELR